MPYLMGAPLLGSRSGLAAELDDLGWVLPRTGDSGGSWTCALTVTDTATMGGNPLVTYDVTLRLYGVIEFHQYSGGTGGWGADSVFVRGGVGLSGTWNKYSLSDGTHTYYCNHRASGPAQAEEVDYTVTIPIVGGATLTAHADSGEGIEDSHGFGGPPDDPSLLCQWLNIEVLSVVPQ